jgi:CRP-like cAMP-binding protein
MFGEIAFVYQRRRTASAVSKNYSTISSLESHHFLDTLKLYPELIESMKTDINQMYNDKIKTYFTVTPYSFLTKL